MMFYKSLCSALVVMSVTACTVSPPFQWRDDGADFVWPEPPERARISYLRSFTGPNDFKNQDNTSEMFVWWFGEDRAELSLYNPFAVSVSKDGLVWVADSGNSSLMLFDPVEREMKVFQNAGAFPFSAPSGIAIDDNLGRVYVADAAYSHVFVLDYEGRLLGRWSPEGGFKRPAGMALSSKGQLLVADAGAGKVFEFDADGSVVNLITSKVRADGQFLRPISVAFGPNDEVLVLDAFSFQIEVQNSKGVLMGTVGSIGDAAGYLARPRGLAVDSDGNVFVSDAAFDNVQVFDMAGNLLTYWGRAGRSVGEFNLPAGLFIDVEGRLFVADSYNHRVQVYKLIP
jgi:DNA-binding beta-propeller fold protein YncE